MALNSWTFSGNVGADSELRSTQSGEKVLSFRVPSKDGFGERETTTWVDCSLWGKRAEALEKHIKKGVKVTVQGSVRLEEFTKRDGTPGSKLAVRVSEIDLSGGRSEASGGGGGQDYGSEPARGGASGCGGGKPAFDDLVDSMPFVTV